ncbi:MAG: hypothetical protein DRJ40_02085 [Thermoprotei archaeon]|nr:MAG: hypothetical protein DRJ40_02085 [Thermoprotei archaeon]
MLDHVVNFVVFVLVVSAMLFIFSIYCSRVWFGVDYLESWCFLEEVARNFTRGHVPGVDHSCVCVKFFRYDHWVGEIVLVDEIYFGNCTGGSVVCFTFRYLNDCLVLFELWR